MTLTGLQHHFPDKESLLAAVLEERDKRSQAEISVEPGEDATEKLLSIVERNEQTPHLTQLHTVLSAEATAREHPAHAYSVQRYARQREAATRHFQQLIELGLLGSAVELRSLASILVAVTDGLQLQWLLDKESVDMKAELRRFLTIAVPALAALADPDAV